MIIFDKIPGYSETKEKLIKSFKGNRVSHAQIFHTPDGAPGVMLALGYLQLIFCENSNKPCGSCSSCIQIENLSHPDLHFSFPYVGSEKGGETCEQLQVKWRNFVSKKKFFMKSEWNEILDTKNKQPQIYKSEGQRIIKTLSLKSYSGKYKVQVIWQPELFNETTANKLLKFIEEPDPNTLILMVSHNVESILPTILSRSQVLTTGLLQNEELSEYLISTGIPKEESDTLSVFSDGNLGLALLINNDKDKLNENAQMFLEWLRACFKANPIELNNVVEKLSKINRDPLKRVLYNFQTIVRTAYSINTGVGSTLTTIDLNKVAPFITNNNISDINKELDLAIRDVARNGNTKIILTDLSLRTSSHLHNYNGLAT